MAAIPPSGSSPGLPDNSAIDQYGVRGMMRTNSVVDSSGMQTAQTGLSLLNLLLNAGSQKDNSGQLAQDLLDGAASLRGDDRAGSLGSIVLRTARDVVSAATQLLRTAQYAGLGMGSGGGGG